MSRSIQLLSPQFRTVSRIERPEVAVNRRAYKNKIPGRRDTSSQARCSRLDAFGSELLENAECYMPGNLTCIDIHCHEFTPRWRVTGILGLGIPEPAALRRHFPIRIDVRVFTFRWLRAGAPAAAPALPGIVGIDLLDVSPLP